MYIFMKSTCEKLFTKTQSLNLTLSLQAHFSGMAHNPFWKKSSSFLPGDNCLISAPVSK